MQHITYSCIRACETHVAYASEMFRPYHGHLHSRRVWLFKFVLDRMSRRALRSIELVIDFGVKPVKLAETELGGSITGSSASRRFRPLRRQDQDYAVYAGLNLDYDQIYLGWPKSPTGRTPLR